MRTTAMTGQPLREAFPQGSALSIAALHQAKWQALGGPRMTSFGVRATSPPKPVLIFTPPSKRPLLQLRPPHGLGERVNVIGNQGKLSRS
jgi:hypothetical protein